MTERLPDRDDIQWVDLVRVTWGTTSGVDRALLNLHLGDGRIAPHEIEAHGMTYETLLDWIESFNRLRRRGSTRGRPA